MQYVTTTSGSSACSCDRSTLEQQVSRAETAFAEYLAASIRYPDLSVQADPDQAAWWRVAHCCHTIYLRPDQPAAQIVESAAEALAALRRRDPHGTQPGRPCRPHLTALPGGLAEPRR